MKKTTRKLFLSCETLNILNLPELQKVNGGLNSYLTVCPAVPECVEVLTFGCK